MADETQSASPTEPTASPETGTEGVQPGNTQTPSGEASQERQGATADVSFLPKDVNSLPPEVRAYVERINNDMVRGFTEKTQKLAEERKSFDPLREKAAQYDRLLAEFKARQATVNGQRTGKPTPEEWQEAQFDPAKQIELQQRAIAAEVAPLREHIKRTEALAFVEQFSSAKDANGQALRPDFGQLSNLGEGENALDLINVFYAMNPAVSDDVNGWNVALNDAYTKAKQWYDSVQAKVKADVMASVKKKASGSSETPSVSAGKVYTGPDPKKITDREAVAMAMRGERIPQ